jgi:hypothetical protein
MKEKKHIIQYCTDAKTAIPSSTRGRQRVQMGQKCP